MKYFVAGFLHETNTFVSSRARYSDFAEGANGPIVRGDAVLALRKANLAIGGFIAALDPGADNLIPGLWAHATPSGPVTEDAFERIADEIVGGARAAKADAIFLDLHGAMVAEHVDDGEGELLRRVREAVGADTTIAASLDLHANVTAQMFESADVLVAYRTYPHVDMADTGARAARLIARIGQERGQYYRGIRRGPFLVPIEAMTTWSPPAADLYRALAPLEADLGVDLSIALGFPAADIAECGPTIWGYGTQGAALDEALDRLYRQFTSREEDWRASCLSPDDAVMAATAIAANAKRPVVIADTHDNPGAGADSNTTEMLAALLRHGVNRAALGIICDPAAAAAAHAVGVGSTITLTLAEGTPRAFHATFVVDGLSNGECRLEGPMMRDVDLRLGPCASLRIDGVRVVVSSVKTQLLDCNLYRMVGIQPEAMAILVNKSSVHFRAAFEPIAEAVLVARTADGIETDPAKLPWRKLNPAVRVAPRRGTTD
ncbi:microcystinase C [Burkholderia lata]|uniref:M81 family metallopeptidase n=1 Tax=Burkholderia lata (strain ATCC 17760 / DSM 23089 / LMG 22485 / NCIMB 9086 / R18194 / 383) TaxID=482957 RepID=UPI0014548CAB|nr:M81 family metallopeptidase [Burkholderia lata]VWD16003.1 microcystinase C [Burkholderia lata]